MSIIGNPLLLSGGGFYASIWLTGDVASTDTVTCTMGSKSKTAVWTTRTISGESVSGWLINKIVDLGTWTVAITHGSQSKTYSVNVDAGTEYDVTVSYLFYLYNAGDECEDLTGGWTFGKSSTGTIVTTKNASNLFASAYRGSASSDAQAWVFAENAINIANYSKLKFNYTIGGGGTGTGVAFRIYSSKPSTSSWPTSIIKTCTTNEMDLSDVTQTSVYVALTVYCGQSSSPLVSFTMTQAWLEE